MALNELSAEEGLSGSGDAVELRTPMATEDGADQVPGKEKLRDVNTAEELSSGNGDAVELHTPMDTETGADQVPRNQQLRDVNTAEEGLSGSGDAVELYTPMDTEAGADQVPRNQQLRDLNTAEEGLSGSGDAVELYTPMDNEAGADQVPGKESYEQEIDALVKFFNEEEGLRVVARFRKDKDTPSNVQRKKIATFLEGSRLPFSALVKDIFEKLSGENDQDQSKSGAVTLALVRSNVLSLGERVSFGITNADADVLEDDTPGSLWCWEVRDAKLFAKASRDELLERRRWRKKVGDRIAVLSAAVEAFQSAEAGGEAEKAAFLTARETLGKVDDELAIRAAKAPCQQEKDGTVSVGMDSTTVQKSPLAEKSNILTEESARKRRKSDPEERERLRQEKLLKRQQVENEKEQKRKEKEETERKKQQQKQQDEAEKEQKRKEKEEGERKKQEKKQQDEAEKEQKREAERKKQLALKKQASFMDRFLVKKDQAKDSAKDHAGCAPTQQAEPEAASPPEELEKRESACAAVQAAESVLVVARMDVELKSNDVPNLEELWRSHVNYWLGIRSQSSSRKTNTWGVRRKPKVSVGRELRLNATGSNDDVKKIPEGSSPQGHSKRSHEELDCPQEGDWKENESECFSGSSFGEAKKCSSSRYHEVRGKKRKLLQFDKSHRPPYYGTFSKKSEYIKPRHPLRRDPALDYEVDSDEEWVEEEPGESLSDVEKDDDDEKLEIQEIEEDEEGPDEFVVPDGYLSEDEGVAMEDTERGVAAAAAGTSASQSPVTLVQQNVMSFDRLRKVLDNATEHAIRTNHPLIINNLGRLPGSEEETPTPNRTEYMCLEAMRIQVLAPDVVFGW